MKRSHNNIGLSAIFLRIIAVVVISMVAISACAPVKFEDPNYVDLEPEATKTPTAEEPAVYQQFPFTQQGGVRIYYDPQIQNNVDDTGELLPAKSGESLYSVAHPEIAYLNYGPMQAHIYVAPVEEYEEAADFASGIIADLYRLMEGAAVFEDCVPELPLNLYYHECSHQQFVSNTAHTRIGNGQAVRFVSVYGIQDLRPVGNDTLVYVLQGFTDDGEFYFKAIVDLMHTQLQALGEIPQDIYAAEDAETVAAYFSGFTEMFNQSEDDFTPQLDWIDNVMASLYIEEAD